MPSEGTRATTICNRVRHSWDLHRPQTNECPPTVGQLLNAYKASKEESADTEERALKKLPEYFGGFKPSVSRTQMKIG
jgi:hypothetical protein